MLTEVTPDVAPDIRELAQKMLAKQNERLAKMKVEIAKNHPHALVDTLVFDQDVKKFKCNIRCVECGDESRVVYTSDLHQVSLCCACSDRKKEAKKSLQKAQQAAARRLISSGALSGTLVHCTQCAVPLPAQCPHTTPVPEVPALKEVECAPLGWDKVETSCPDNETPVETPAEPKKRRGGRPKGSKNKK